MDRGGDEKGERQREGAKEELSGREGGRIRQGVGELEAEAEMAQEEHEREIGKQQKGERGRERGEGEEIGRQGTRKMGRNRGAV